MKEQTHEIENCEGFVEKGNDLDEERRKKMVLLGIAVNGGAVLVLTSNLVLFFGFHPKLRKCSFMGLYICVNENILYCVCACIYMLLLDNRKWLKRCHTHLIWFDDLLYLL